VVEIELALLVMMIWVSWFDIRFHLIRNIDLVIICILLIPNFHNWFLGCLNLFLYLVINLIAKGRIGAGDIKLSFLLALQLGSFPSLLNSLSFTWILGGLFALVNRSPAIAFAPFMICGTYLARIL
jgi:Flp pilus assembly protein protease CpaA